MRVVVAGIWRRTNIIPFHYCIPPPLTTYLYQYECVLQAPTDALNIRLNFKVIYRLF